MQIPGWFLTLTLTLLVPACGGSTANGRQQDPAQLVQDACNNIVGLQCSAVTQQQCNHDMNQARVEEAGNGCGSDFDAVAKRYADQITDCSQDPRLACVTQLHALDACEAKGKTAVCSGVAAGSPPPGAPSYYQQCAIACPSWSVRCVTKTSPILDCTCTTGPKTGATFTAPSCNGLATTLGA